jgi:CRP/FNR family transcriptional regulator, cyclic AMP receptor protein
MTTIGYVCGFIGAGLTLASYMMKSMLPLRWVALIACIFFVVYGWLEAALPSLFLYALMIPINIKKIVHIRKLVRAIESAKAETPVAEWLLPHMSRREAKAGELLWAKGDAATEMIYLESGSVLLVEHDEILPPGSLAGEIGLFTADKRRTLSLRCETDCVLFGLSAEAMAELYYQNPKLGYHVMRLIVARLMHDVEKARAAAAAAPLAAPAADPSA